MHRNCLPFENITLVFVSHQHLCQPSLASPVHSHSFSISHFISFSPLVLSLLLLPSLCLQFPPRDNSYLATLQISLTSFSKKILPSIILLSLSFSPLHSNSSSFSITLPLYLVSQILPFSSRINPFLQFLPPTNFICPLFYSYLLHLPTSILSPLNPPFNLLILTQPVPLPL